MSDFEADMMAVWKLGGSVILRTPSRQRPLFYVGIGDALCILGDACASTPSDALRGAVVAALDGMRRVHRAEYKARELAGLEAGLRVRFGVHRNGELLPA